MKKLINIVKKKGIEWFASAWDLKSQEFLRNFNCNYNKVASAMLIYEDLLKKLLMKENILLFQQECQVLKIYKKQ